MGKKYREELFDSNQDLDHKRRKLYEWGTEIIERGSRNRGLPHESAGKKKMTIDEYIERDNMQQKWIDHYKIHRRY